MQRFICKAEQSPKHISYNLFHSTLVTWCENPKWLTWPCWCDCTRRFYFKIQLSFTVFKDESLKHGTQTSLSLTLNTDISTAYLARTLPAEVNFDFMSNKGHMLGG